MAESTNMSYLYTIGGYATLIGVGYALYQVSTQKARKRVVASQAKPAKSSQPEPRKEEKKKKLRKDSSSADAQAKARSKAQSPAPESAMPVSRTNVAETADDGIDNREFAKQLSKAKQGKQFARDAGAPKGQKEKSVKQSRASQMATSAEKKAPIVSGPSSTTGADADDDMSPAESQVAEPKDAGGVADMLEPTPTGPSVLRLTDTEVKSKGENKPAKAPEPVETKKQRQNRKKAEAAKAAREEAEKERRILEEKQRRTARIAEGRLAKDGSQFTNARVKDSAWSKGAPNGGEKPLQTTATNGAHELLDTFEAPAAQPAAPSGAPEPKSTWVSSIPSEEEQMELLKNEDEWSTVKTRSSKKSGKKDAGDGSGDDAPMKTASVPEPKQPAPAVSTTKNTSKSQSFGTFSALTTKDEPAEEVEEEWDV